MEAVLPHFLPPLAIAFGIAVVLLLIRGFFSSGRTRTGPESYKPIDFMNTSEHVFYIALRRIAPPHIAVLAKVRVADIIAVRSNSIPAFNRIARKHVDFVLYNLQTRKVLRAIELDGPTHQSAKSRRSDNVKNSCFASARVPLARVPVSLANNPETIRGLFSDEGGQTPGSVQGRSESTVRPRFGKGAAGPERKPAQQAPPTGPTSS